MISIVLSLISCRKEAYKDTKLSDSDNDTFKVGKVLSNIKTIDGIFYFNSYKQYLVSIKKVKALDHNSLLEFYHEKHFTPYMQKSNEAIEALDKAVSVDDYIKVLNEYEDYLITRERNGESYTERIVGNNVYTLLANWQGLYVIGKNAFRLLGDYILESDLKGINTLLKIHYSDILSQSVPSSVKIKKYSFSVQLTGSSKQVIELDSTGNTWNNHKKQLYNEASTANRKVTLLARCDDVPSLNSVAYSATINVTAYKRYWFFGYHWKEYNTHIDLMGTLNNQDDFVISTPWGVRSYKIYHYSTVNDYSRITLDIFGPEVWDSYPGPEIFVLKAHLKAWTRGTTSQVYAQINYDF